MDPGPCLPLWLRETVRINVKHSYRLHVSKYYLFLFVIYVYCTAGPWPQQLATVVIEDTYLAVNGLFAATNF